MSVERIALPGSERLLHPNSRVVGAPDPSEQVQATVYLRRRTEPPPDPGARLDRAEFAARHGADPADVARVEEFAAAHDLTVTSVDMARRSILLSGTVANMNEAFGIQLRLYESEQGRFRGRTGPLHIPASVAEAITGVFGLDDRPQSKPRLRRHVPGVRPRAAGDTSYTPDQVARLYDYPAGSGAGQTVAIIELGGGYRAADLNTYFQKIGAGKIPQVTAVGVDGAANQPTGDPNGADGEVLLDIEVVGAIVPGAKIVVYFAPNSDQGFLDAITTAVHDNVRKPSVVSISWGGPESTWTDQALTSYDMAFQDAALLGVTVCCASGDDGSSDGVSDGAAHADFPAASPNVLACGGTRLQSSNGKIDSEAVWNHGPGNGASGGGVSEKFPLPAYQARAGVPASVNPSKFHGRGLPDVSGDADPATGYQVLVDGRNVVYGGTSAVAPLWAALIALINTARTQPVGFLNPLLYGGASTADAFHDIVTGDNGAYKAGQGWDACTGLGSPNGAKLAAQLAAK